MKKMLFVLMVAFSFFAFTPNSHAAEKLYVVNSGSATGTFNSIMRAYAEDLKPYYDVELVHAHGCAKASSVVRKLDAPTFVIWDGPTHALYLDGEQEACVMEINKDNFVRAEFRYDRLMVNPESGLTLEDFRNPNATWKVGHDQPVKVWESFVNQMGNALGNNLISVPYQGSGDSSLGLLSGEVDFLLVNSKKATTFENEGEMRTLATFDPSGLKDRPGIPSVSSLADFKLAKAGIAEVLLVLNATEEEKDRLREVVKEVHKNPNTNIVKWYETSGFADSLELGDEEGFKRTMELIEVWRK